MPEDFSLLEIGKLAESLKQGNKIQVAKRYLSALNESLNQRFAQNEDIVSIIHDRCAFIDELLIQLWNDLAFPNSVSLIAVGGYGRGELHPYSDIDLLLLLGEEPNEECDKKLTDFITLLWDIKLDIGHSVRTIAECVNVARDDITIATNLMESRVLAGNEKFHEELMAQTGPENIWPSPAFFRAKWDEQIARHRKFGNSEYNLEPNIKSCPGGLRDIQMIGWIAKRHFGVDSMESLVELGFLQADELDTILRGQAFLWQVRYALHMLNGREEDRLLFDQQRTLSEHAGYKDDDAKMAVEQFMQVYYQWAMRLGTLNDVLMQAFDESILRACEVANVQEINQRFTLHNGHIEVANAKVFLKNPSALLEIFVLLAHRPDTDGVRADTIRLIQESLDLIDEDFRDDPRNQRLFMEIVQSRDKVALQLRRMLRWGVLARYIPSFGAIIGQMQHDLFHIYSVDAHTMELVKNLRRFQYDDSQERFPIASRVMRRIKKPEILYIAGLFHDIAKGRGGDHSKLGMVDAREFCERHSMSIQDTNLVVWLVEKHLLMSAVAQRADISDPEVIQQFALDMGDQLHLDCLFTLTIADINATNPKLWNNWRASLMRQLYDSTKQALRRGLEIVVDKAAYVDENKWAAIDVLEEDFSIQEEEILPVWENISDDYFLRELPDDIAWHTQAILAKQPSDSPLVLVKHDDTEATQIFVRTPNEPNVFALVVSALEQLDLSIVDARVYSAGDSPYTLDIFYVLDSNNQPLTNENNRISRISNTLDNQLADPNSYPEIIRRRTPRALRLFSVPTITSISTDISKGHTVLEVLTPDRPGLLARIGLIFLEYGIKIQNAKITTLGERVEDLFFITDSNDQAISDPALCADIQRTICEELDAKSNQAA